jgi:ketosteroid isomerase-like protein
MNARGLERSAGDTEGNEDAAWAVARRWIEAFNRRDADALLAVADAEMVFHPTLLAGARRTYRGHEGLRLWLADVAATGLRHTAEATALRRLPSGEHLVSGSIFHDGEAMSPFSMRFRVRDGKLVEAWAYLSDEALLGSLGRLDPD